MKVITTKGNAASDIFWLTETRQCVCHLSVCPRFTRINHFSKSYTLILNLHDQTVLKVEAAFVFYLFKWEITCDWPGWLVGCQYPFHAFPLIWLQFDFLAILFFRQSCCTVTPTLICTFFPMPIGKKRKKNCQAGATLQTHSLQDHICAYIFWLCNRIHKTQMICWI